MPFEELDVVRLKRSVRDIGLYQSESVVVLAGEIGTIINARNDLDSYEVEFLKGYPQINPRILAFSSADLELVPESEYDDLP